MKKAQILCWLLAVSSAVGQEMGPKKIERGIAFARGLAEDFGFLGLAEDVLEKLGRSEGLDGDSLARIGLERKRLCLLRAKEHAEIQGKWELVQRALGGIGQLIGRIQSEELGVEARDLYMRAALEFGEILEFRLEGRVEAEARAAWIGEADTVYRSAIEFANEVHIFLYPRVGDDSEARSKNRRIWATQGELIKEWAHFAPEEDRANRTSLALDTLRDFLFGFGPDDYYSLRSVAFLGQCYELEGKGGDAREIYLDVIQSIWTDYLRNPDREFTASAVALLTRVMEEAYFSLIRFYNRLGQTNEALAAGAEMVARFEEIGREFKDVRHSLPQGMRALVEYASALRASGEEERAIRIAADVSTQAGNRVSGFWARRLIGQILEDLQGVQRLDSWLVVQASTGWLEWEDGAVREVRGLERWVEALGDPMRSFLEKIDTNEGRFSLDWYRVVCQYVYVSWRAGMGQGRHLEKARELLALARGPEDFARLKGARPMLTEEEQTNIRKLDPAEREVKEKEWAREREVLLQFFLYLSGRLGE